MKLLQNEDEYEYEEFSSAVVPHRCNELCLETSSIVLAVL